MPEQVSLLRIRDVSARVALSRSTIYDKIAAGTFPRSEYPSPGAPRWRSDVIEEWLESLSAPRDDRAAA